MRLGLCTAVAVLALSFVAPEAAEETFTERYDRFRLFANCLPMSLIVEDLNSDAEEIGLTRDSVQAAVESRLRSARLYDSSATPYLYVNVNVYRQSFSISLEYNKFLFDGLSQNNGYAATWTYGGTGQHANDHGFILSSVSQYMDQFLVEFLRVNEEACAKR